MFGAHCETFVISLVMLISTISINGQSPCPYIFRYATDEISGEIIGRIEIPGAPKNVPLHLHIILSVATALPTQYVGRLELDTSKAEAVAAVNQGRPLNYRLSFPLRDPIPLLTKITFNGQLYCTGRRATGPIVTSIFLEHTLYPPGVARLSENGPPMRNNAFTITPPPISQNNNISPRPVDNPMSNSNLIPILAPGTNIPSYIKVDLPTTSNFHPTMPGANSKDPNNRPTSDNERQSCGRPIIEDVNYLIAQGERIRPGQWPWVAAIFIATLEYKFQCGGSLVTNKHVITAAHCKINDDTDVPASAFLVALGRFHLDEWREENSKNYEVLEFRKHPEYHTRNSADADLAIIVLREKVQFTRRIQPVCLWTGPVGLESFVGLTGNVVGWGRDQRGNQYWKEPRMVETPIVSQEDCLRSNVAFVPSTSNRTFCAGRRDGSGPCNGDSGSGFVILDSVTGRYNLRGVVSLSLWDRSTMSCDLSQYIVYADVAKYMDWIKTQIND